MLLCTELIDLPESQEESILHYGDVWLSCLAGTQFLGASTWPLSLASLPLAGNGITKAHINLPHEQLKTVLGSSAGRLPVPAPPLCAGIDAVNFIRAINPGLLDSHSSARLRNALFSVFSGKWFN